MDAVDSAELVAGHGLRGNANVGGTRQVTLIDGDAWREASAELARPVDPSARRANLMVVGLPLTGSRGRRLQIGPAVLLVKGETRPCERMDEACPGLRRALEPDWRGGVYARVERGGTIRPGDSVQWLVGPENSGF